MKKYPIKYYKKEKEGEELEMQLFFEKNLSNIFPNLGFFEVKTKEKPHGVGHEWEPYGAEDKRVDILAFHEKNKQWKNLVIIECKLRKNTTDAQIQAESYLNLMREKPEGNFSEIKEMYNDCRIARGDSKINWSSKRSEFQKEFWKNCLLVCIAEAPYFTKDKMERADHKGVILIEVKKYGDDDFILISLANGEKEKKRYNKKTRNWMGK